MIKSNDKKKINNPNLNSTAKLIKKNLLCISYSFIVFHEFHGVGLVIFQYLSESKYF